MSNSSADPNFAAEPNFCRSVLDYLNAELIKRVVNGAAEHEDIDIEYESGKKLVVRDTQSPELFREWGAHPSMVDTVYYRDSDGSFGYYTALMDLKNEMVRQGHWVVRPL